MSPRTPCPCEIGLQPTLRTLPMQLPVLLLLLLLLLLSLLLLLLMLRRMPINHLLLHLRRHRSSQPNHLPTNHLPSYLPWRPRKLLPHLIDLSARRHRHPRLLHHLGT